MKRSLPPPRQPPAAQEILDLSLAEQDPAAPKAYSALLKAGYCRKQALIALAAHKSEKKYGYTFSETTLPHILNLATQHKERNPLDRLCQRPLFLAKTGWLYDHSPFFFFHAESASPDRDLLLLDFAKQYEQGFLQSRVDFKNWRPRKKIKRLRSTSFWERSIIDPIALLAKARKDNLEGVELSIDFHPFNFTRLLPEELSAAKRAEIREACRRGGLRLDIHSPIVGPYVPSPDPAVGKQRFFDPANCFELFLETAQLAKEIGAESLIVHLIDPVRIVEFVKLVESVEGSEVIISLENYCHTATKQTAAVFIEYCQDVVNSLSPRARQKNFGITMDFGHLNIEGEDPLLAAEKIGSWCLHEQINLRIHATDNYGDLLFSPPFHSADVHSNVSGRGINNGLIIRMLRSMGLNFSVVAEQIPPLLAEDIKTIHEAQSFQAPQSYEDFRARGRERLDQLKMDGIIGPDDAAVGPYQFLTGLAGVPALREYIACRRIQQKKHLSVTEAQKISQDFYNLPPSLKESLATYLDDLLLPIQTETGSLQKNEVDLICQNISSALYTSINNDHLNRIFAVTARYGAGEIISRQHSLADKMYLIKEGSVTVSIDHTLVATLGTNEIFGEISLFYSIPRSATITAESEVFLGVLTRAGLEELFQKGHSYAHDLIYRLYTILPERLRNMNDKYKTAIQAHQLLSGQEITAFLPHLDQQPLRLNEKAAGVIPLLPPKELNTISWQRRSFPAGAVIFREGDEGDGAYILELGEAEVVLRTAGGEDVQLGILRSGDIFGEMALISDKPRSATIITTVPCKTRFIDKASFRDFVKQRSQPALRLMGHICLTIFRRILLIDKMYVEVKKRTAKTKQP